MDPRPAIFPAACRLCGRDILPFPPRSRRIPPGICGACLASLRPIAGRRCGSCGKPLVSEAVSCTHCRQRRFAFSRNRALYLYLGEEREFLRAYKFTAAWAWAGIMARGLLGLLEEEGGLEDWRAGEAALVPVPSSRAGRKARGWDPVGRIAGEMSRIGGRGPVLGCLRKLPGRDQKELGFQERQSNMAGRIALSGGSRMPRAAILVDDLFTTGATLDECARVLAAAGCLRVSCLTVAVDP